MHSRKTSSATISANNERIVKTLNDAKAIAKTLLLRGGSSWIFFQEARKEARSPQQLTRHSCGCL
jgi:hypothetical protein